MQPWSACPACGLKHSVRADGRCPRCRARVSPAAAAPAPPARATPEPAPVPPPTPAVAEAPVAPGPPSVPPAPPAPGPWSPADRGGREGSPSSAQPRRVWTVLLAWVVVLVAASIGSAVVVVVAAAGRGLRDPAAARSVMASAGVFFGALVVTAAVQVGVALVAARLSREPARRRLGLGGGKVGGAALAAAAVGCAAVSSVFDAAFGALGIPQTGSIADMSRVVAGLSPTAFVVAVAVVGVAAPFAEELFFRGYVQTRLCRRWGAWTGITVTAALFGLLHFDWIHSPSAFAIGVYLGWLAARGGGIAPAIAAHAANNVLWTVAVWSGIGGGLGRGANAALLVLWVALATAAVRWLRPRLAASAPDPAGPVLATTLAPPLGAPAQHAALAPAATGSPVAPPRDGPYAGMVVALVWMVAVAALGVGVKRSVGPASALGRDPGVTRRVSSSSRPSWSAELPVTWSFVSESVRTTHVVRASSTPRGEPVSIYVTAQEHRGDVTLERATDLSFAVYRMQIERVSQASIGAALEGSLVHATGRGGGAPRELMHAVFVYPDAVISMAASCSPELFDEVWPEFEHVARSLRR